MSRCARCACRPACIPRGASRSRRRDPHAPIPSVHGCGDALSGALMNAGPMIHPPLMVMNAAPLQHFERWDIHNEGTQPAVRAVTDRLDQERIAVREALGYAAPHYPLADHYNNDRWMYGDAHKKLVKSGDWRETIDLHTHRYITEDTELGLAFLASVARWSGHRRADRQRLARHRRRLPRTRPAPRSAHARGRWAWPRCRATRWLGNCRGRSDRGPLCRCRGRPHGTRHRDRVCLCRPPHCAGRPAAALARSDWQRLCDEAATRSAPASAGWRNWARWRRRRSTRSPRGSNWSTRGARRPPRARRAGFRRRAGDHGGQARRLRADQPALHGRRDRHLDHQQHPGDPAGATGASSRALPQRALAEPRLPDPGRWS